MANYLYDVFISHSEFDLPWVRQVLVPRLEAADISVFFPERDKEIGAPRIVNLEEAVEASRKLLVVLSPSYVSSEWNSLENILVQHGDPANQTRKLLPIVKTPCAPPVRISMLNAVDFAGADPDSDPWAQLIRAIGMVRTPIFNEYDIIPVPAPLPPGSRMPFSHNPDFVGREPELRFLARALQPGVTAAIGQIAAAHGMGGIGKTQLAVEFVHRYGQYFQSVHWLSFAEAEGIAAELAACAIKFRPELANLTIEGQIAALQASWEQDVSRLLVFDSCENEKLIEQWRPATGGCAVLLTSRNTRWSSSLKVQPLALGVLPRGESVAILCSFRPDLPADNKSLDGIAEIVGDLPLALHLAGSYLKAYQDDVSSEDYLAELQEGLVSHESMHGESAERSSSRHMLDIEETLRLSYCRLSTDDTIDILALKLLSRAAFFAPGELLPRYLLKATLKFAKDDKQSARLVTKALRRLVDLGLIEHEGKDNLRLHRLISDFVRSVSKDYEAQYAVEETMVNIAQKFNKKGVPAPLLAIQPHLRAITVNAQKRNDILTAELCNAFAYHLTTMGYYKSALPLFEQSVDIHRNIFGPDHPKFAMSLNNLAAVFQNIGNYAAALPLYEDALRIHQNAFDSHHPQVVISLNNLASLLKSEGNYAAAQPLFEKVLRIRLMTLAPNDPKIATSMGNLGALLQNEGKFTEARPFLDAAVRIHRDALGSMHPDTATSLNNLGSLLQHEGNYTLARPLLEEALEIRRSVLGHIHPDTATSLNNLAMLLENIENYEAAKPLYEEALQIKEIFFGSDHLDVALCYNNLGSLYYHMGDRVAAKPLYEKALSIMENFLGIDHPKTIAIQENIDYLNAEAKS